MTVDGRQLRQWRESRGLSLRELAARCGVGASAISEMERGQRRPHPRTIRKLAAALDVAIPELLRREDHDHGWGNAGDRGSA